eukprot:gnl/MRDRNA2_/MRDRNA2_87991_c0_seq1.p1 gnl/MRDRNA2_/MRDRNA2_87991_c0~~gnl/MRDRNA2_/MRDRNA2_87991_c0_seq1.p1  ORF type:complete len:332 (+),score=58.83 gnl/MRDRNA2_/MRDRNA2_87991_c0_seq1:88-996(+)
MAILALPAAVKDNSYVNGRDAARVARSPLERVSEGSESDTSPERRSPTRVNARAMRKMGTMDLMRKLDERDKEVQELLLAGEALIQSTSCSESPLSNLEEESPMGFQWDVPDFPDVLGVVATHCDSQLAKHELPESSPDVVDCSPLKRTRCQYESISESAKGLASMMAGMSQHLAQLSDPNYLDDLLALHKCSPHLEDAKRKSENDVKSLSEVDIKQEVECLRQENQKLRQKLDECEKEKAEMSTVLQHLEDRLTMSNECLKDAAAFEETNKPKYTMRCGSALLSLKAQQWPTAAVKYEFGR